jgi:hypothetical protein
MLQLAGKGIATKKNRNNRSAPLFQVHNEREAQHLLDGGLAAAGLSARELDSSPGSDVRKVALANLLLERTVARQSWIADKLHRLPPYLRRGYGSTLTKFDRIT